MTYPQVTYLSSAFYLSHGPPTASQIEQRRRCVLSKAFSSVLDRVNLLGNEQSYGHTGCVNALSWAREGELLLSGGDDRTVRIWCMDPSHTDQPYPFICTSVIQTGHKANIFNAHLLPFSSRIATVAGDKQIRVFDVMQPLSHLSDGLETLYTITQTRTRTFRCHKNRVKRIVTEESPDLFLTVAEDGTVRQHDLRVHHTCSSDGSCPSPLVNLDHELSTLALSPLTPYQFVVAGDSPFGYLFDRRYAGRFLREEWGILPKESGSEVTSCVRRFGRTSKAPGERRHSHVTGARMSSFNGHEVLLSYSSDAIYLYSTYDDPKSPLKSSSLIPSNRDTSTTMVPIQEAELDSSVIQPTGSNGDTPSSSCRHVSTSHPEDAAQQLEEDDDKGDDEDEDMESSSDAVANEEDDPTFRPNVPIVLPRRRFAGACNVETVKDVNFLGPEDEYVTSGSDDGNFFIWRKSDARLHGIYEGDGQVVNVIEGHPHLPLVAVSGIDHTVKLFGPAQEPSKFSRMENADSIVEMNTRNNRVRRIEISSLLLSRLALLRANLASEGAEPSPQCTFQ